MTYTKPLFVAFTDNELSQLTANGCGSTYVYICCVTGRG